MLAECYTAFLITKTSSCLQLAVENLFGSREFSRNEDSTSKGTPYTIGYVDWSREVP